MAIILPQRQKQTGFWDALKQGLGHGFGQAIANAPMDIGKTYLNAHLQGQNEKNLSEMRQKMLEELASSQEARAEERATNDAASSERVRQEALGFQPEEKVLPKTVGSIDRVGAGGNSGLLNDLIPRSNELQKQSDQKAMLNWRAAPIATAPGAQVAHAGQMNQPPAEIPVPTSKQEVPIPEPFAGMTKVGAKSVQSGGQMQDMVQGQMQTNDQLMGKESKLLLTNLDEKAREIIASLPSDAHMAQMTPEMRQQFMARDDVKAKLMTLRRINETRNAAMENYGKFTAAGQQQAGAFGTSANVAQGGLAGGQRMQELERHIQWEAQKRAENLARRGAGGRRVQPDKPGKIDPAMVTQWNNTKRALVDMVAADPNATITVPVQSDASGNPVTEQIPVADYMRILDPIATSAVSSGMNNDLAAVIAMANEVPGIAAKITQSANLPQKPEPSPEEVARREAESRRLKLLDINKRGGATVNPQKLEAEEAWITR